MTQKDNIAQELRDLASPLADYSPAQVYAVPDGYFEGLAALVLRRIRAMEAATTAEELGHLSPLLSQAGKANPYTVPEGYFEGLESSLVTAAMNSNLSAAEETESLSPLLGGLKKEMPYHVPAGYFEQISVPVAMEQKNLAKVVAMGGSRKWFRYAAAAVVTGIIALSVVLYNGRPASIDPNVNSHEWVMKNTKKISNDNIEEFIQLTKTEESSQETIASAGTKVQEVKDLIKDVPEEEIQDFLKDTEVLDDANTNNASDESMNP